MIVIMQVAYICNINTWLTANVSLADRRRYQNWLELQPIPSHASVLKIDHSTAEPDEVCRNNTVHKWSHMTLKTFSISCGLDSIRRMAVEYMTLGNISKNTERLRVLAGRLHVAVMKESQNHLDSTQLNLVTSKIEKREANNVQNIPYETAYYNTKQANGSIPEPFRNSRAKSLAFIRGYNVGGSSIASLLTMNAYMYNKELWRISQWQDSITHAQNMSESYNRCFDISGTEHASIGFYRKVLQRAGKKFYCGKEFSEFLLVSNPVERLWKGYQHANHLLGTPDLETFLSCKKDYCKSNQPPHYMIARNVTNAISLSQTLLALVSDSWETMDQSLMLLSIEANMSICDFMYEPCWAGNSDQESNICQPDLNGEIISPDKMNILRKHVQQSGEAKFYKTMKRRFQSMTANNTKLDKRLKAYKKLRRQALLRCSKQQPGHKYAEVFLALDPRVKRLGGVGSSTHWVLKGEKIHPINPKWLCMQWFCHETQLMRAMDSKMHVN